MFRTSRDLHYVNTQDEALAIVARRTDAKKILVVRKMPGDATIQAETLPKIFDPAEEMDLLVYIVGSTEDTTQNA